MRATVLVGVTVASLLISLLTLPTEGVTGSVPEDSDLGSQLGVSTSSAVAHSVSTTQSPQPSVSITLAPTRTPAPSISPKPSPSQIPNCIMEIDGYVTDAVTSDPIEGATVEFNNIWFTETAITGNDGLYWLRCVSESMTQN